MLLRHVDFTAAFDTSFKPHLRAVGILRYVVDSTRPELVYQANVLSRLLGHPTAQHLKARKQLAQGTQCYGLLYKVGTPTLRAQSDSDFAACMNTRQSTYGTLEYYGNCLISWFSLRIRTVITIMQAAEYIGANNKAHEIQWLRKMQYE